MFDQRKHNPVTQYLGKGFRFFIIGNLLTYLVGVDFDYFQFFFNFFFFSFRYQTSS